MLNKPSKPGDKPVGLVHVVIRDVEGEQQAAVFTSRDAAEALREPCTCRSRNTGSSRPSSTATQPGRRHEIELQWPMITGQQIRKARALVGWTTFRLARESSQDAGIVFLGNGTSAFKFRDR